MSATRSLDHAAMQVAYEDMGLSLARIAEVFNCSVSTVRSFASYKGWRRSDDDAEDEAPAPLDPLGDALEAAGYLRHTVTTPCTDRAVFGWGLS